MLGVLLDPLPAVVAGLILVGVGVMTLVPLQARVPAAAIGFVAVGLAGIVIPRIIDSFIETPATNELMLALIVSGVVLLLSFTLLRLTAFQTQNGNPT